MLIMKNPAFHFDQTTISCFFSSLQRKQKKVCSIVIYVKINGCDHYSGIKCYRSHRKCNTMNDNMSRGFCRKCCARVCSHSSVAIVCLSSIQRTCCVDVLVAACFFFLFCLFVCFITLLLLKQYY